ncbi:MAG: hypothetical protein FWD81_03865, partial [Methanomassiliicoccaceae archaeon]|nr:hypothetical protein [Methanomassiliicoccaceae archaeon]
MTEHARAAVAEITNSAEIRRVLAAPRAIPRVIRNETADILAEELMRGYVIHDAARFTERYGLLFNVLAALRSSAKWTSLRSMANRNDLMPPIILHAILPMVLDIMEGNLETNADLRDTLESQERRWDDDGIGTEVGDDDGPDDDLNSEIGDAISKKLDETEDRMSADMKALDLLSLLFPGNAFDLSVR